MVEKPYEWTAGAALEEHTKRKLRILREYFARYLGVRCQLPQQQRFRLAIVEGFAGAGRYDCGTAGSPVVFLEELQTAVRTFNIRRSNEGFAALDIECLLVLNDATPNVIELLKSNVEPLLAISKETAPKLHLRTEYLAKPFQDAYQEIKALLQQGQYRNVLFNLDQCGHSHVERKTLVDIIRSFASAEVFYTFAIEALLAFLSQAEPQLVTRHLGYLDLDTDDIGSLAGLVNKNAWLGTAERLVFETFRNCAPYVSPFSINNPDGWRYWLIHFANSYRARQEYNNVLHRNSSAQAHFGRSGLNMLSYDPADDRGGLYLFDVSGRVSAKAQLSEDIPRLVSDFGDSINVGSFYESIYNMTPAHMDDIHAAMIDNPDLEIITEAGGERRKPNTIAAADVIRLKRQRTFFPLFPRRNQGLAIDEQSK